MKLKKRFCLIIILLLFSSISINFFLTSQINNYEEKFDNERKTIDIIYPKSADTIPLNYINQTATEIYRLFETINFTVDISSFTNVNYTNMQISFTNGSVKTFPMTLEASNTYFASYKPEYNAPLGLQNVSFFIYDENDFLIYDRSTYVNFTIKTNYMANFFPSNNYYIGDTLNASLSLNDFVSNNETFDLAWNVTVVDSDKEITQKNLFDLGNDIVQFKFKIKNETFTKLDEFYYVKVNMTEKISSNIYATYFPFMVLNNIPKIITNSINFSEETIYRTDSYRITLNATDVETLAEDLIVKIIIENPNGDQAYEGILNHDEGNTFTRTFSIPADNPIGKYKVNFTVEDQNGKMGYYITYLDVENKFPKIHSFKTNGISMNDSVTILYGKELIFTFNASDEVGVAYVKVALIDNNNEWFNITKEYTGPETRIIVRTVDLRKGTWFVYVFVTDTDGKTIGLSDDYNLAPQQIKIISDVLSAVLPWITFIVGILLGVLAGIGISYRVIKRRVIEKKTLPSEKKEKVSVRKRHEKKIAKISEEEPIKEEEKEVAEEEKEEKVPYRKIKRKLK